MTIPLAIVAPTAVLLAAAVVLSLVRVLRGPSALDRVVALDVLLAVVVCGLGLHVAATGSATFVPVLLALALLGFVSSVSVARLVSPSDASATGDDVEEVRR